MPFHDDHVSCIGFIPCDSIPVQLGNLYGTHTASNSLRGVSYFDESQKPRSQTNGSAPQLSANDAPKLFRKTQTESHELAQKRHPRYTHDKKACVQPPEDARLKCQNGSVQEHIPKACRRCRSQPVTWLSGKV